MQAASVGLERGGHGGVALCSLVQGPVISSVLISLQSGILMPRLQNFFVSATQSLCKIPKQF